MVRYDYDDTERDTFLSQDENVYSESDYEEDYEEESGDDLAYLKESDPNDLFYEQMVSPPLEWRVLKLGDTSVKVSNEGNVKFPDMKNDFYVTKGFRYPGTCFRYVNVEVYKGELRKYYVHDLVWRAFNEEELEDTWEVRHDYHTPLDDENCFINHLDYLDLYPNDICRNFKPNKVI